MADDGPKLRLERDHAAVVAGDRLSGWVILRLSAPARVTSLLVSVAGRELLQPAMRWLPFAYLQPAPRPWGRSQTGSVRLDYQIITTPTYRLRPPTPPAPAGSADPAASPAPAGPADPVASPAPAGSGRADRVRPPVAPTVQDHPGDAAPPAPADSDRADRRSDPPVPPAPAGPADPAAPSAPAGRPAPVEAARRAGEGPVPDRPAGPAVRVRVLQRQAVELPAGEYRWPFAVTIPATALPSYGGVNVLVEHEVTARAVVAGRRLEAWQPLHVWQAPAGPRTSAESGQLAPSTPATASREAARSGVAAGSAPVPESGRPAEVSAAGAAVPPEADLPGESTGPVTWRVTSAEGDGGLLAAWRVPVGLTIRLPSTTLDIWVPLTGTLTVENPSQVAHSGVALELVGRERARQRWATEQQEVVVARWDLPVPAGVTARRTFALPLPRRVAPTLQSPRFRLDWRLRAMVKVPWRLGGCGELEVVLRDGGGQRRDESAAPTGVEER